MTTGVEAEIKSYSELFIGGKWVQPSSSALIPVVSPIHGQVVASVPEAREADIDAAVAAARRAFDTGPWPRMSPAERAEVIRRVADEVKARHNEMSAAFTLELGAPSAVSNGFHDVAADIWESAASLHENFEFEQEREWKGGHGTVVHEPLGVVASIIPWNGPVATATVNLAPALAAGCTVVLKPAWEGPVSLMILAEALEAAGLPEGVVSIVPAGREVGEYLVGHRDVDKVTFTGSTAAGRRVMAVAAERVKRVTLELGGKSAAIIADDIPLEKVFPELLFAGIGNSGQVCAALTRILVPRVRQEEIVAHMKESMESLALGDPRLPDTVLGPLAMQRQKEKVLEYVRIGKEEGARLVTGGKSPEGLDDGCFVQPTLFADVSNDMRIAQEEIFGPVLVVIPFDSVDEAIEIANDSDYGLSGAVYANDVELAERIARSVRTGQMSINSYAMCFVQPFGGYKQSGLGREGGPEGFASFHETKLIQR